jgi:mRNA-degrading endonuclease RelE of RelBE toxin-antitoxin system
MTYDIIFADSWDRYFSVLDNSVKGKILHKIEQMREKHPGRHLRFGADFFVEEMGQYRILYAVDGNLKIIYFAGAHKDYEKYIGLRK